MALLQDLRSNMEVLQVMHEYLNQEEPELQRILFEVWNAQRESLKYGELTNVLLGGEISFQTLQQWQADYVNLINEQIAPRWQEAMKESASHFVISGFAFATGARTVQDWLNNRSADLIQGLTESQIRAIRFVASRMNAIGEITGKELSTEEMSRFIRPLIGLTPREAEAVRKYYQNLIENDAPRELALRQSSRYAGRLHRHRANRIARTEIAQAYNFGADESVRQAQNQGYIGRVQKQFLTSDDERVCPYCGPLDGTIIEFNEKFKGATKTIPFVDTPPLHPHCRCVVAYIE